MKNCHYSISTNHCSGNGGFSGIQRAGHRNAGFQLKPGTVFPRMVMEVDVPVNIVRVRTFNNPHPPSRFPSLLGKRLYGVIDQGSLRGLYISVRENNINRHYSWDADPGILHGAKPSLCKGHLVQKSHHWEVGVCR